MFDVLLTGPMLPFTTAIALLIGLMLLELVVALIGGTLLGIGADGPDFDAPDVADLDLDLDVDVDPEVFDVPSVEEPDMPNTPDGGLGAWLGFGKMPALIWLAVCLFGFGVSGYALQSLLLGSFGAALPAPLAALPAGLFALWFARGFGAAFARLLPKSHTEAVSERHLGRRTGVVTQGTAKRGTPAEVKVTDRFGNIHYLRAEPLRDDQEIAQGSTVIVLRHKADQGYRLVLLNP